MSSKKVAASLGIGNAKMSLAKLLIVLSGADFDNSRTLTAVQSRDLPKVRKLYATYLERVAAASGVQADAS